MTWPGADCSSLRAGGSKRSASSESSPVCKGGRRAAKTTRLCGGLIIGKASEVRLGPLAANQPWHSGHGALTTTTTTTHTHTHMRARAR